MARIGQNPNNIKLAPMWIGDIVLTCITHLPNFSGYHANRLEVVQKCLTSMRHHAGGTYTVIIWDNDSCEEFREWVKHEYRPNVFIRSGNIGKLAACAALFGMLEPETIVNYSDDDIYYYPNWLLPQIKLLKHFPDVACVSGYPTRSAFGWGIENTIARLKPIYGRFIPRQWEIDYARSVGSKVGPDTGNTTEDSDVIVKYKGVRAFATSHHCQYVGKAGLLATATRRVMSYDSMPNEMAFDITLDEMGNRLATLQRYTRHMGNVLDEDLQRDILIAEKMINKC